LNKQSSLTSFKQNSVKEMWSGISVLSRTSLSNLAWFTKLLVLNTDFSIL